MVAALAVFQVWKKNLLHSQAFFVVVVIYNISLDACIIFFNSVEKYPHV